MNPFTQQSISLPSGIFDSTFRPSLLLRNSHLQTILPVIFPEPKIHETDRRRIELPDGDFVDLDYFYPMSDATRTVLLLHGLTGSTQSQYIQRTAMALHGEGFAPVALNFRGASGEPNRLARAYHSGDTEDVRFVLQVLRRQAGKNLFGVVGFSLGANVLLKYLGEEGRDCADLKTVAVSVPFDLTEAAHILDAPKAHFYRKSLLKQMKAALWLKRKLLPDNIDFEGAMNSDSFFVFDNLVTAPLNGFKDVYDYYSRSSSLAYLTAIRAQTLILQSKDDPFLGANRNLRCYEFRNGQFPYCFHRDPFLLWY